MTAQCINAQVSTSLDRRSRLDAEPLANEYSPSKLLTIAMQRRRELLEQPTPDYRRQLLNKALVQCLFKLVGECRRSSDRRSPSSRRRASRRRSQLAAAQKRKLQRAEQHESSPKRMRADNVESTDCEQRQGAMALSQFSSTSATGMTAETYNSVEYEQLNTQPDNSACYTANWTSKSDSSSIDITDLQPTIDVPSFQLYGYIVDTADPLELNRLYASSYSILHAT